MAESGLAAFYRTYAARCVEVSREVPDIASKFTLLGMAQVWLALADQAETSSRVGRKGDDAGVAATASAPSP
jgi:hypothetical protein